MVGFIRDRMLRLLKRTSVHNRPGNLAAAVALGLLAGALPKANLLFAIVAAMVVLLPIHNLLSLAVCIALSLLMTRIAPHADLVTDRVGMWLLELAPLRSMWLALDALPIVPWLCLHNSVVLGSLVIGIICLAPSYLIALRLFERWEFMLRSASITRTSSRTIRASQPSAAQSLATQSLAAHQSSARPALLVEQPVATAKGNKKIDQSSSNRRTALPDESSTEPLPVESFTNPIPRHHLNKRSSSESTKSGGTRPHDATSDYEPVREVESIINAWHIGHAKAAGAQLQPSGHPQPSMPQQAIAQQAIDSDRAGKSIEALRSELNSMTIRDQSLDSLSIAHSATEVLAWVDDLLDECLIDQGLASTATQIAGLEMTGLEITGPEITGPEITGPEPDRSRGEIKSAAIEVQIADGLQIQEPKIQSLRRDEHEPSRDRGPLGSILNSTNEQWVIETSIEIVRLADESNADQPRPDQSKSGRFASSQLPGDTRQSTDRETPKKPLESAETMYATQTQQDWQAASAGLSQLEALLSVDQALDRQNYGSQNLGSQNLESSNLESLRDESTNGQSNNNDRQNSDRIGGHRPATDRSDVGRSYEAARARQPGANAADGQGTARILNLSEHRDAEQRDTSYKDNKRPPVAGFQQLVMAESLTDSSAAPQPRALESIEPVRGESLAYLLGHLRQVREGKSS